MPRYIDADSAINDLCGSQCGCTINECGLEEPCEKARCILKQPTADVQEVKYAKWTASNIKDFPYLCTECNNATVWHFNYCPHCGAEMKNGW